jgi:hypothetical protein
MGAQTSEVSYTSATTKKGDHEVYMDMWFYWGKIWRYVKVFRYFHTPAALPSIETYNTDWLADWVDPERCVSQTKWYGS